MDILGISLPLVAGSGGAVMVITIIVSVHLDLILPVCWEKHISIQGQDFQFVALKIKGAKNSEHVNAFCGLCPQDND